MLSSTMVILISSLLIAFLGWLATAHAIHRSTLISGKIKRLLIIPSWFPWMIGALGSVVTQNRMSVEEAVQGTLGFSVGLIFFFFSSRGKISNSSNIK